MHDEDLKKLRELKNKIISSKENEMMGKFIKSYKFKPGYTNEIYYCESARNEYLTINRFYGIDISSNNFNERCITYVNLEDSLDRQTIFLENRGEFEANHQVIYGQEIGDYEEIRNEFFTLAINNGQKEAVQKILEKYGKPKKNKSR